MLAHYLALAAAYRAPAPSLQVSGLRVVSNPGFCNFDSVGEAASMSIQWDAAHASDAYELHLLESGTLAATLPATDTDTTYPAPLDVENAGQSQQEFTFHFTLQVVRKVDGVVIQELSTTYSSSWGVCR